MEVGGKPDIAAQIAGALAWWREAGVDLGYHDEAANWLQGAAPATEQNVHERAEPTLGAAQTPERGEAPASRLTRTRPNSAIDAATLPTDLCGFSAWWLSEPALDGGIASRRVPPRGTASPELMVIVAEPEEDDTDALLSGPQGRLLAGILTALGTSEDLVYLASALPRRTPLPDWAALAASGLGKVLTHHIGLVDPKRILLFGNNILSLLAHDSARKPSFLPSVNHAGPGIPLWVELDLAAVLARPRSKAGLWNRLLDWTRN